MEGLCKRKRKEKRITGHTWSLWMYILLTVCTIMYVNYRNNMCTVQAASASGTWGTCTWTLSEEGVLTVSSGTGEDVEYVDSTDDTRRYGAPWSKYSDNIKEMIFGADDTVVFPKYCPDMFKAYTECKKIVFKHVNTSEVTTMENMFENCEKLEIIEGLDQFCTDKVTNMEDFFSNCTNLSELDLTSFDTRSVKVDANYGIGYFFNNNSALNKICFGDHFTFKGSLAIDLPTDTKWYKQSEPDTLIHYDQLSKAEENGTITLSGIWFRAEGMYWGDCKYIIENNTLTISAGEGGNRYQQFHSPWDDYANSIEIVKFEDGVIFPEDCHELFIHMKRLKEIDLSNVDMSKTKNMHYMFGYCSGLQNISLNAKKAAHPTKMTQMFASCTSLQSVTFGNMDTSENTSWNYCFYECYNLKSVDFEKINVSKAESFNLMFGCCFNLRAADMSGWICNTPVDMSDMFNGCTSLTKVTFPENGLYPDNTNGLFRGCLSLNSIKNMNKLYTSSVTDMAYMFFGCKSITSLDLSHFDTTKVTKIHQMFSGCENLTELDLSSFNTTKMNMTQYLDRKWRYSMEGMFDDCNNLGKVTVSDTFKFLGGRSVKINGSNVLQGGSLPANSLNPDHKNEWYIFQSSIEEEKGKWIPIYSDVSTEADITDLEPANRIYTKYENGITIPSKTRLNFGDLEMSSNLQTQYEYTGQNLRPEDGNIVLKAIVNGKEITLTEGRDYEVEYPENAYYVGAYGLVHFNGIGDYCGQYTVSYYVCQGSKISIDSCVEWPGSILQYTYTGYEIKPLPVSIKDNGKVLTEGKDYRIQYKNNVNAAAYYSQNAPRIYVYGMGDYVGSTYCSFTINPKPISSTSITAGFKKGTYPYTGEEIIPDDLIVTDGDTILRENVDYSVHYYDNKEIGDNARAGIWGEGNYSGIIYSYFTITERAANPNIPSEDRTDTTCDHIYEQTIAAKASFEKDGLITYTCTKCNHTYSEDISKVNSVRLSKSSYTYNGKNQKPAVVLSDRNGNTLNSVSYSIQYPKVAKNIGRYTLMITLSADQYEGTQEVTFDIVPQKIQKVKLQSGKKQIKIKWKKAKNINGYEIQYALSGGKKTVWKKTSTSKRKNSTVIKKLAKKKKYTIRIRSYKVVKCNGKKIRLYSDWVQKTIKTK